MPTKPTLDVRSASSQRDNRWLETVYDQHKSSRFPAGRPFWGYLEYPSDKQRDPAFTCELLPGDHADPMGSTWSAPWLPSQVASVSKRYYRLDVRAKRITWLYSTMIEDDKAAMRSYYEAAAKIAYEKGWPAPAPGEPVGFQIETILGEPPRSHKIPEAALAGDRWLLGFEREPNTVLDNLLRGVRTIGDSRGVVTPEQVLSTSPEIQSIVAKAVAEALAAQRDADRARIKKARAARDRKHGVNASPAAPIGAQS